MRRVGSEARISGEARRETQAWPARTRVGGLRDHMYVVSSVWREAWLRPRRDVEWRRRQRHRLLLLLLVLLQQRGRLLLLLSELLLIRLLLIELPLLCERLRRLLRWPLGRRRRRQLWPLQLQAMVPLGLMVLGLSLLLSGMLLGEMLPGKMLLLVVLLLQLLRWLRGVQLLQLLLLFDKLPIKELLPLGVLPLS